jgi:hypothetical protein
MDKLKELLKGIGASGELTSAICEELERYSASLKSRYDAEYQQKIERAKKVCVEEVNKEKSALARRLKTFLESKAAAIEQAAARSRAIEESESAAKLKKAKAVLEGVELKEGSVTNSEIQDAQKKIARLEKACATLKEERNLAVAKANTANSIAAKALQRNRALETKAPVTEGYCKEHHLPYPKAASGCAKCSKGDKKDDGKKDDKKMDESKTRVRLDESRSVNAGSQAPRKTLMESHGRPGSSAASQPTEIQKIAQTLE